MNQLALLCIALVLGTSSAFVFPKNATTDGKLWALLVAGSNTYDNYRHQADVCHAYQILHAHGIPDENIVVMMYDDIANNIRNPTKGIVINHPNGDDVYHGVLKDYTGKDVTPQNFINILTGNKDAMKGIGSGKVIDSGPNDHVFVNFVDHGATGIVAFPSGELTVKQLNDAIKQMHDQNRYNKLVIYVEACESGSMFRNTLPTDINVYATTASDWDESSYACYYDATRKTYLGDWYSVNWMEDSDKEDIETETLDNQFQVTKQETHTSHVQEYGDLTLGSLIVGQFQGLNEPASRKTVPKVPFTGVPSLDVPLDLLYREALAAKSQAEKKLIRAEIDALIEKRVHLDGIVQKLVARVSKSHDQEKSLVASKPEKLTQLACHNALVKAFSQNCFDFGKHQYALKHAYVLANMCEQGIPSKTAIEAMQDVCKGVINYSRIN